MRMNTVVDKLNVLFFKFVIDFDVVMMQGVNNNSAWHQSQEYLTKNLERWSSKAAIYTIFGVSETSNIFN